MVDTGARRLGWIKCGVVVPNGIAPDRVLAHPATRTVGEKFVHDMERLGWHFRGLWGRIEGPFPHFDRKGLPQKEQRPKYRRGEPHRSFETQERAAVALVQDMPSLRDANGWLYVLSGLFSLPVVLMEKGN